MARHSYEGVAGIAVSNPLYAYIAVRPPVSNEVLDLFQRAASRETSNYSAVNVFPVSDTDNVTEIMVVKSKPFTPANLSTVMEKLSEVFRNNKGLGEFIIIACDVDVDGPKPIFDQYEEQLQSQNEGSVQQL